MAKQRRQMGEILLDLEEILLEMVDHGLQWGVTLYFKYTGT